MPQTHRCSARILSHRGNPDHLFFLETESETLKWNQVLFLLKTESLLLCLCRSLNCEPGFSLNKSIEYLNVKPHPTYSMATLPILMDTLPILTHYF